MRFAVMVDPQEGLPFGAMRDMAVAAEAAGFDAFVRSDHWLSLRGNWRQPANDAWTSLAALASATARIRLGTLVSPVTFRHPVALAKIVTSVDEISDGRVELGMGAGWYEPEHERYGITFPPRPERFELLEEQLQIIKGLWTQSSFSYEGLHYGLRDAVCEPKPVQRPHPPIVVGGYGRPRLLRLAAVFADELNLDSPTPDTCANVFGQLDEACSSIGRDARSIQRSAMLMWGNDDQRLPTDAKRAKVREYERAGTDRLIFNMWPGPGTPRAVERLGRDLGIEG